MNMTLVPEDSRRSRIMTPSSLIYVVDDEPAVADVVCHYLQAAGEFNCRCFTTTEQLLAEFHADAVDCVVADLRMPGIGGCGLHQRLLQLDPLLSVVFISGYADVKTAVQVMERGAVTLLEKPFTSEQLVAAVRRGAQRTRHLRTQQADRREGEMRLRSLTSDERDVLDSIVAGVSNKIVCHKLSISPRTLDRRRRSILDKMRVSSPAQLIALVVRLRDEPQQPSQLAEDATEADRQAV